MPLEDEQLQSETIGGITIDTSKEYRFEIIKGRSGDEILASINDERIEFLLKDNSNIHFRADVFEDAGVRTAVFSIQTKDRGKYHPDFEARKLFKFAIKHFEKRGRSVDQLKLDYYDISVYDADGNPSLPSDTYVQYTEAKAKLVAGYIEEGLTREAADVKAMEEAITRTKGWEFAIDCGFTKLTNIQEYYDEDYSQRYVVATVERDDN